MKWTFGIVFSDHKFLHQIITSIVNQEGLSKDNYEIILVGQKTEKVVDILSNHSIMGVRLKLIDFNEEIRIGWITKKKNLITQYSDNQNICFLHDYVALCQGWYNGFKEFGENWDVCMNPIRRIDGRRFRDWIIFKEWWGYPEFIPYSEANRTLNMYVSGTYWCAKKDYMTANPLDERRGWGQGEDIEWSHRCRHHWNYKMNVNSAVRFMKEKTFNGQMDYAPHPDTDTDTNMPELNFVIQD